MPNPVFSPLSSFLSVQFIFLISPLSSYLFVPLLLLPLFLHISFLSSSFPPLSYDHSLTLLLFSIFLYIFLHIFLFSSFFHFSLSLFFFSPSFFRSLCHSSPFLHLSFYLFAYLLNFLFFFISLFFFSPLSVDLFFSRAGNSLNRFLQKNELMSDLLKKTSHLLIRSFW